MYMRLKDGKSKVLTLSYDDGVVHDIKLMELMKKHGIKGTFNINTGQYLPEDEFREEFNGRMRLSEAVSHYKDSGNEVAVHTLNHTFLEKIKPENVAFEIIEDRKNIQRQYLQLARGMAYPYGTYNDAVIEVLKQCGICYSRTIHSTEKFVFPENWLTLHPTCHHDNPKLMELAKKFVCEKPRYMAENWMFFVWGHSYEFNNNNNWNVIEEFLDFVGGRGDVWYATNIEIYDYIKAYESLRISLDQRTIVHNPTAIDVWAECDGRIVKISAGETLTL